MFTDNAWPLTCSACGKGLARQARTLTCPSGHSFDIAREGYVNLLAPRDAERGITGDTAEMLHARRRFLDSGAYVPLRDAVHHEVTRALEAAQAPRACVVEAGCGEGYYIGHLAAEHPVAAGADAHYIGFDISKAAVRLAARRHEAATFVVANIRRRLYVQSGSVDVVVSICAPRNPQEFDRILGPRGSVLVVLPTAAHLESLRAAYDLLSIEELKEERVVGQFAGFRLASRRVIEFPLSLDPAQVRDLIAMGPNAWHEVPEPAELRAMETLASFVLLEFERNRDDHAAFLSGR